MAIALEVDMLAVANCSGVRAPRHTRTQSLQLKVALFSLQTIMQPAGAAAPGMAPYGGADRMGASDGRGIEGTGIGLEADQPITRDISPAPAKDPFLDAARMGTGVAGP